MNYNAMFSDNFLYRVLSALGIGLASATLLLLTSSLVWAGPAEDVKDASRLYQQGKLDNALAKVNAALLQQPKDAQGRFVKGLILTEQKKTADAIQVFTGLTEDYPELPEPYNNLAVLYASQGNYDKAKAALELAIHTHPSYATAHENLGDIYAQLARRAYDKALQLDKNNSTAQSKLAMVKDFFSPPKGIVVASAEPAKSASNAPTGSPLIPHTPAVKQEPTKTAAPTIASTPTSTQTTAKPIDIPAMGNANTQVSNTINAWAKAWSAKDVAGYLGFYAANFETPNSITRSAWEIQRRERIDAPSSISVNVKIIKITITGNEAVAVFRQTYRSDKVSSTNTKNLKLVKSGDQWLIQSERAGG